MSAEHYEMTEEDVNNIEKENEYARGVLVAVSNNDPDELQRLLEDNDITEFLRTYGDFCNRLKSIATENANDPIYWRNASEILKRLQGVEKEDSVEEQEQCGYPYESVEEPYHHWVSVVGSQGNNTPNRECGI